MTLERLQHCEDGVIGCDFYQHDLRGVPGAFVHAEGQLKPRLKWHREKSERNCETCNGSEFVYLTHMLLTGSLGCAGRILCCPITTLLFSDAPRELPNSVRMPSPIRMHTTSAAQNPAHDNPKGFLSSASAWGVLLVTWFLIYIPGLARPGLLDDADSIHAEAARE